MRMGVLRKLRGGESRNDRGASLVEFAVMMPLLVLLLLGMLEFGWAFAQQIDVRSKAREGLRIAIVDEALTDIQARICADDIVKASDINSITINTATDVGKSIDLTVEAELRQITGLFGVFWGASPTITSTVEGRVEQKSSFGPSEVLACP
jgi:Flp pilus assembly protein TadG